jgi:hypothetical protein
MAYEPLNLDEPGSVSIMMRFLGAMVAEDGKVRGRGGAQRDLEVDK